MFTVEDTDACLWGGEIILRDGKVVGYTTSGSFAHTLGQGIAMGYIRNADGVDASFAKGGDYALQVGSRRFPAQAHLRAPIRS